MKSVTFSLFFLLFPSVLFLYALLIVNLFPFSFQISLLECSSAGGIFLWNYYEQQLFGQLLFVAIYWGNNLPDGTFWSCQFLACKQRASFSLNRMALNLDDAVSIQHNQRPRIWQDVSLFFFFFLKDRWVVCRQPNNTLLCSILLVQ